MTRALRVYGATWLALVVLAFGSWVLSQEAAARVWATPLALVIAGAKALLIAGFFMHLSRGRVSSRLAGLTAVGLIGILASLMAADILTRVVPIVASPVPPSP